MTARTRFAIPALTALALALGHTAGASAATTVLGAQIPCATQADGVRFCQGSTSGAGAHPEKIPFDGSILDVNVTLPAVPSGGSDGNFPLVIVSHGYGGSKKSLDAPEERWLPSAHELAKKGYAVLNTTTRGFGESCGSVQSRLANPACAMPPGGWIELMDARYEVHDVQHMAGELADEGWIAPQKIGAIGESYGGGESLLLATLKDRTVGMPPSNAVSPWTSPQKHIPLAIAAATPTIPWSDLISSLLPNGHTLTYTVAGPADDYAPGGDLKQSFVAGLYASGQASGYYAPPGVDSQADLTNWFGQVNAFPEPPENDPQFGQIVAALKWKSPWYFLNGSNIGPDTDPPAPMLLSNGFTDDLFPVDETIRYYNLEKTLFPNDPVQLTYMDYGHMRGQNKPPDIAFLKSQIQAWLDHYVLGTGPDPGQPVTALTQTCPSSAPSGGPFVADTFLDLAPGALPARFTTPQTIDSSAGDPSIAKAIDPVAGGGACATTPSADQTGVATYRLPAATGSGYTMLGAPTIYAQMSATGTDPIVVERLWDVAPDGTQSLVARGDFRPSADLSQVQVFQLHPGAWHFAAGHIPKLELLGQDPPYLRAPEGSFTVTISALGLILPTHDTSGNGIQLRGAVSLPLPAGAKPIAGVKTAAPAAPRPAPACPRSKPTRRTRSHAAHRSRSRRHTPAKHKAKKKKKKKKKSSACTRPVRHKRTKHKKARHHRARRHTRRA